MTSSTSYNLFADCVLLSLLVISSLENEIDLNMSIVKNTLLPLIIAHFYIPASTFYQLYIIYLCHDHLCHLCHHLCPHMCVPAVPSHTGSPCAPTHLPVPSPVPPVPPTTCAPTLIVSVKKCAQSTKVCTVQLKELHICSVKKCAGAKCAL